MFFLRKKKKKGEAGPHLGRRLPGGATGCRRGHPAHGGATQLAWQAIQPTGGVNQPADGAGYGYRVYFLNFFKFKFL